jgi:outer membrane lipoprotein-sorting protein
MKITETIRYKLDSQQITKMWLSDYLGVSRVTLDTRLEKSNWKKGEIALLKSML